MLTCPIQLADHKTYFYFNYQKINTIMDIFCNIKPLILIQIIFTSIILPISAFVPQQNTVIGIYTQDYVYGDYHTTNQNMYLTYFMSSYTNIVHMSGAHVVPIFAYDNQKNILQLLSKVNGVIFTGGDAVIDINNKWTKNAKLILDFAQTQNDNGKVFPVLGICQGLQLMLYLTSNMRQNFLDHISGDEGKLNPVNFVSDQYYLFNGLSNATMNDITNASLTKQGGIFFYYHSYGILQNTFQNDQQLKDYWNLIALSTSSGNDTFVTYLQAKNYPFYITQFHPERIVPNLIVSDPTYKAQIQSLQKMSLNFIIKARQSKNVFPRELLLLADINNYALKQSSRFTVRIYLFQQPNENGKVIQNSSGGHAFRIFVILLIAVVGIAAISLYFFKHRQQKQLSKSSQKQQKQHKDIQLNQQINETPTAENKY